MKSTNSFVSGFHGHGCRFWHGPWVAWWDDVLSCSPPGDALVMKSTNYCAKVARDFPMLVRAAGRPRSARPHVLAVIVFTWSSTTIFLSSRDTRRKRPRHSNRIPSRPHCFSPLIFLSSIVPASRSRQNYRRNAATTWQPYARPFTSFWLSLVWKILSHSQHFSYARSGTE